MSDQLEPNRALRLEMVQGLQNSISRGWPRQSLSLCSDASLTPAYREYFMVQNPGRLFEQATIWLSKIRYAPQPEIIYKELQETLARAIFGSNQIERAGLDQEISMNLCRKIFAGEALSAHEKLSIEAGASRDDIRSWNEVVQHAKAYQHLIHTFVIQGQDLSEELIQTTHKILTTGVPIVEDEEPEVSPEAYGGIYRKCHVQAGTTNFSSPRYVPKQMREMCENLKRELDQAEARDRIDPFSTAAKYSLEFVMIHPFRDGNGRMCRMILNAILCRYLGIVVPIGEQQEDRNEYIAIKRRASTEMEGHGEYTAFILRKGVTRLRELKKKLATKAQ